MIVWVDDNLMEDIEEYLEARNISLDQFVDLCIRLQVMPETVVDPYIYAVTKRSE